MFQSRAQLAAENLFLRKQLACYVERQVRPRRTHNASRIALVLLSPFVDWRQLLTILFHLFWRLKSRQRGRPRIPIEVQRLIAEMATHNRTWGEERIAAELRVKLGLTVSPRTVRRYMPPRPRSRGGQSITGHLSRRMLEHYSHIRLNAKEAALDRLDAALKRPAGTKHRNSR